MKNGKAYSQNNHRGFGLLETCIAVMLFGLIFASFTVQKQVTARQEKLDYTQERLSKIEDAIGLYIHRHGHLPCPAPLNVARDTAAYGLPVATDCVAGGAGTIQINGRANMKVRIGAIPARVLNLTDDYMMDGWGNLFTFAVTSLMASSSAGYEANEGAISVVDQTNTTVISPAGTAMYAIVGHGGNGKGAYSAGGGGVISICSTGTLDFENCNGTATFRSAPFSESGGAAHFDDYVRFRPKEDLVDAAINRYILDFMDCDEDFATALATLPKPANGSFPPGTAFPGPSTAEPNNQNGENCSTEMFSGYEISLVKAPPYLGLPPKNGRLLYTKTLTSKSTGQLTIRATIPVRYSNQKARGPYVPATGRHPLNNRPYGYEGAIQAAIYIDDQLKVIGDLINPEHTVIATSGGTGVVMATAPITKDVPYKVDIYLFTIMANEHITTISGQAGTIKLADYDVRAAVEIMESGTE